MVRWYSSRGICVNKQIFKQSFYHFIVVLDIIFFIIILILIIGVSCNVGEMFLIKYALYFMHNHPLKILSDVPMDYF